MSEEKITTYRKPFIYACVLTGLSLVLNFQLYWKHEVDISDYWSDNYEMRTDSCGECYALIAEDIKVIYSNDSSGIVYSAWIYKDDKWSKTASCDHDSDSSAWRIIDRLQKETEDNLPFFGECN